MGLFDHRPDLKKYHIDLHKTILRLGPKLQNKLQKLHETQRNQTPPNCLKLSLTSTHLQSCVQTFFAH